MGWMSALIRNQFLVIGMDLGAIVIFSTIGTRSDGGMGVIKEHMKKLKETHELLISLYGENNETRLTGKHETSSIYEFSFDVANRGKSCRIPRQTDSNGKGYYEDRRPAANIDPYVVSSALYSATCLDSYLLKDLDDHYKAFVKHKKTNHL